MTYPQFPLVNPITGDPRTAPVRETGIVGQMADKLNAYIDAKADFGAVGDGVADDSAAVNAAVSAAAAAGGMAVVLPEGDYLLSSAVIGAAGVQLVGYNATLVVGVAADDDAVRASSVSGFVVEGLTIDGSKATQTLTNLVDTDYTSPTRGVALLDCSDSGLRNVVIANTLFHGMLVDGGADNFADGLVVADAGLLANNAFGSGLVVNDSPRFSGRHLHLEDSLNSQVRTSGGTNCAGVTLDDLYASGGPEGSPISINSTECKLSNFTGRASTEVGSAGLNVGHANDVVNDASGIYAINGLLEDNAAYGISLGQCFDGRFVNIRSKDNAIHNLNIFGDEVGRGGFVNCDFDATSDISVGSNGVGVVVTSSGAASVVGQFEFHGCRFANSAASGLLVAGVPGVRVFGGIVEDNTGVGARIVDNTSLGSDFLSVGTTFRDTRSGGARTQTLPFTSVATGGNNYAYAFAAENHVTSDNPSMPDTTEFFLGTTTGDRLLLGGGAGRFDVVRAATRFRGNITSNAAAPAYSFDSREDQGWYSKGATEMGWSTGGVEQMSVDGDGLAVVAKVLATGGLGVGNSVAATTPGTVTDKMEVFDASGASLGFVAIYDAIT